MNIGTYVQFKHARVSGGPLSGKIIASFARPTDNKTVYVVDISYSGPQYSYLVEGLDNVSITSLVSHPDNLIELATKD